LTIIALLSATTASSCAYVLSPHQRGNRSGPIDAPALVGDLLLLIPGIVPGVIALTVDITSGAIRKSDYTVRVGPAAADRSIERPGLEERPAVERPERRRASAREPARVAGRASARGAPVAPDPVAGR